MKIEFNPEKYLEKLINDIVSGLPISKHSEELVELVKTTTCLKYINVYEACTNVEEIQKIDKELLEYLKKVLTIKQEYTGIRDGNKKNPFDDLIDKNKNPLGGPWTKPYNPYYPEITLLPNIPPKYNDIICHNDINMNDANTIKNNITRGTL